LKKLILKNLLYTSLLALLQYEPTNSVLKKRVVGQHTNKRFFFFTCNQNILAHTFPSMYPILVRVSEVDKMSVDETAI